jgi:hypothetical protein
MTSDLTWGELARELERQPDTRKDNGAVETALEARRVPGDGRTRTVVLDRGNISGHTLIPHAAILHPAPVLRRATPPSTPAMTLSTRSAPGLNKGTDNPHAPAGTLSCPPGGVIPGGHPPGRRPCGTRGPHVSPDSQRRHPVWFSSSPNIILRGLQASRPGSLRSSPQKKKDPRLTTHSSLSSPFFFRSEPGHTPPPDWDPGRENHTNRMTPDVGNPGRARRACVPRWPRPFKGPAQGLSSPPGELRPQSNLNLFKRRPLASS